MTTKIYSREELKAFEQELQAYRVHKTVAGEELSYIDFDQYLIDKRACVRQEGSYAPAIVNVPLYEELTDKIWQLRNLFNKRAYAEQKRLEKLAEMQS